MLNNLVARLNGPAWTFYSKRSLPVKSNYHTLCSLLESRFEYRQFPIRTRQNLKQVEPYPDEGLAEFMDRITEIVNYVYIEETNDDKAHIAKTTVNAIFTTEEKIELQNLRNNTSKELQDFITETFVNTPHKIKHQFVPRTAKRKRPTTD